MPLESSGEYIFFGVTPLCVELGRGLLFGFFGFWACFFLSVPLHCMWYLEKELNLLEILQYFLD